MKTFFLVGLLGLVFTQAATPPNFVVIMGEAQGWASLSVPLDDRYPEGSKSDFILTPHLDSIALNGLRFSDFYAASPRCTPSRAAFFTGQSPARLHMTFVNEGRRSGTAMPGDRVIPPPATEELPARIETLGAVLKKQGYATAHFGKWHVGRVNPSEHGFDESDGPNNNGGPDEVEDPNPKQCHAIAGLAVDFISRQTKVGKPFYVQLSEYPGRGLHPASPEKIEAVKVRLGNRLDYARISTAAGDEEIDDSIGVVLAKLKELGLMENTYVVYTADHGAQGRRANGMLTNGKGTVWEGGLRVPLLVCGPGIKAGGFTHVRASTVDLFPTLSELAGVKAESLPAELEGGSLKAVWMGEKNPLVKRPREEWVVHFPHYDKDDSGPASALFLGSLKLIRFYETDQRRLFDLSSDLSEQQDLAAKESEKREALEQRLTDYLSWVGAGLPVPNPHYVPGGERSGDRGSGGGGRKENRPRASESKPPVPVPAP